MSSKSKPKVKSKPTPPPQRRKWPFWVAFSVAIAASLGWVYYSNISLLKLFFKKKEHEGKHVGFVATINGKLRRQSPNTLEFVLVKEGSELFEDDTVMTGPDDRASLSLVGQGLVEVRPNSLLRLSAHQESRIMKSEEAKNNLIVRASPTLATPTPILQISSVGFQILAPKSQGVLAWSATQKPFHIVIQFQTPNQSTGKVSLSVKNAAGKTIAGGDIPAQNGFGQCAVGIPAPGQYRVELSAFNGVSLNQPIRSPFSVK